MSDDQRHPERTGDEPVEPAGAAPAGPPDAVPAGAVPADAVPAGDASPADASAAGASADEPDAGRAPAPDDGGEPDTERGGDGETDGDDDTGSEPADAAGTGPHDDSDSGQPAESATTGGARRRRVTVAGAFIGVLLGLLGFALVVQLRSNAGDAGLANERPEDLVQILSDLDARQQRLRLEIANLQSTKAQLEAGSQSRDAALQAAAQRADELGILAGTLAAQGPGVVIKMFQGSAPIKASVILDTIEELRDAGAEAMQIDGGNGVSVRIIASTYFVDGENGAIVSDGKTLSGPFSITAIGDPQTLQPALNIAGGVVDTVEQAGGTVTVLSPATVTVATTVTVTPPKYAEPAN
jgi:uncharacterized protein YlxW (UPF0749 family)